jgi:asparagine synthase (glutamine-hydrolysing)
MSAICGVIGLDGRPWNADDLDGVIGALAPLGRDGGGTWDGIVGRCGVAVAAALRHSTPEDAADRQPVQSEAGQLVLVGDLRLDNRAELAAALGMRDECSVPDTALVLAAYERWGEGFLERLQGEFALAIVDRRRGGLLLARDHVGTRPLVTHERRGVLAFASTALALTGLEGVGHALDVRSAMEALALLYASDRTFVEGVRWLPPATALWAGAGGVRRWAWWNPDPSEIVDLGSPAAHERELRQAFDQAVAARLRSAGRVGAMVSGGLDSSSGAATAARQLAPEPLPTYTSVPPPGWTGPTRSNWDADESPLVRKLAELHPNLRPSFIHVQPGISLFDSHEPLWELGAEPPRNPCNWLWLDAIGHRAGMDGVTTLLNGNSGNFFFSADAPEWLAALLRTGRLGTALREARAWSKVPGEGWRRTLRAHVIAPLLPARARRLIRISRGRADPVSDLLAHAALRPELAADVDLVKLRPLLDERRLFPLRQLALWMLRIAGAHAATMAAQAASIGIEQRDPTVDRRVIEVAMRQPDWVRRHDGTTRAVVRGAMADRLPPEIVRRTRRGDQLPDWLDVMTAARSELARELDELGQHATSRVIVDTDRLRQLMERWPDRAGAADVAVNGDYRQALLRTLLISRYMRWFERRAASLASPRAALSR